MSDLEIALAAMSDARADAMHGFKSKSSEWRATKISELRRLRVDYETNGENSEVGRAIKRVQDRQSK